MVEKQVIDEVKGRLSILDVIAHDGLTVVQRGNKFSTQEHESLILYPATNSWARFSQADQQGKTLGGDVYQWYQHYHSCSFKEAHSALSAMAGTLPQATVAQGHRISTSSAVAKDYREFAVSAWNKLQSSDGEAVATYLASRSISLESAKRWGLGAHYYKTKTGSDLGWAVTFPSVNTSGKTSVNMRLIQRTEDKCRLWGQRDGLFGVKQCSPNKRKYLFAVEGELNCVSIGQAAGYMGVDAVSIGNKSLSDEALTQLVALGVQYRGVLVWTDEAADTQRILASVPGAIGYKSPKPDGQKLDANDMLQRGILSGYIATLLERHADREEAQSIYAALYQQHQVSELDAQTFAVAERIAQKWQDSAATSAEWEQQRDARWVHRWANGYTEDTPHTRRNAEAAAQRLGVQL